MHRLSEWDRSEIFEIWFDNSMIIYCLSLLFSTILVIIGGSFMHPAVMISARLRVFNRGVKAMDITCMLHAIERFQRYVFG